MLVTPSGRFDAVRTPGTQGTAAPKPKGVSYPAVPGLLMTIRDMPSVTRLRCVGCSEPVLGPYRPGLRLRGRRLRLHVSPPPL